MNEIDFEKQKLRKVFLSKRCSLSSSEISILSNKIAKNFVNLIKKENIDFKNKIFGSYIPTEFEAKPIYIEQYLTKHNCQICYPKIDLNSQSLNFILDDKKNNFLTNKIYSKILEPHDGKILIPDYLLVPLVAFDDSMTRLGMGKGFYDRTIKTLKILNPELNTFGIAFKIQKHKELLPTSYQDFKLDYIIYA